jgi:hypothetical protein
MARGERGGEGHEQVLCQAAAVLVSLATGFATKFSAVALLAILGKRLPVARTPHSSLVILGLPFIRQVVLVIDGAFLMLALGFGQPALCRKARRR